jgi:hypothetical protein
MGHYSVIGPRSRRRAGVNARGLTGPGVLVCGVVPILPPEPVHKLYRRAFSNRCT